MRDAEQGVQAGKDFSAFDALVSAKTQLASSGNFTLSEIFLHSVKTNGVADLVEKFFKLLHFPSLQSGGNEKIIS